MGYVDRALYKAVNRLAGRTAWAHGLLRLTAKDGIAAFGLLLLIGWWIGRTSAAPIPAVARAVWAGAGALLALAINQPIGAAIARARPYAVIPGVHLLVDKTTDFSFASDHATAAGAVAAGLFLVDRRLGIVASLAALAMAFARVYVGAHYPGDVVAGLALGAAITLASYRPAARLLEPLLAALAKTPLRPVIVAGRAPASAR